MSKSWCAYCGSAFHNVEYCPNTWTGQFNLRRRWCDYCGSKEHDYEDCPEHV